MIGLVCYSDPAGLAAVGFGLLAVLAAVCFLAAWMGSRYGGRR